MKKVLITAYDVNPYSGSESATGWNYPFYLSKNYQVTLITRKNNLPEIRRFIYENKIDDSSLVVKGFDLPYWMRFWKRGARGSFIYYYLWQLGVALSEYKNRFNYDVCHALNFHSDSVPSFLWLLGRRFVWGPVNHNECVPGFVFEDYGNKEYFKDRLKFVSKLMFWNFDPLLFVCKAKADVVFAGHNMVASRLRLSSNDKCIVLNQVATDIDSGEFDDRCVGGQSPFNVLFVGRGLPIKNYLILLDCMEQLSHMGVLEGKKVVLTLVGIGAAARSLVEKRAKLFGLSDTVKVIEWVGQDELKGIYRGSDIFCFPSFEGGGVVLAEALSFGLPLAVLDGNGVVNELNENCTFFISSVSKGAIVDGYVKAILKLIGDSHLKHEMSKSAYELAHKQFSWSSKAAQIGQSYLE